MSAYAAASFPVFLAPWWAVTILIEVEAPNRPSGKRWLAQNSMICPTREKATDHHQHLEYERGILAVVREHKPG